MPTPFSTATVDAIAQAARQFTDRLTALEDEAAGIRRILAILHDGNAPTEEAAERRALGSVINTRVRRALAAEPTTPAPAVEALTAWQLRKAREAERDAAGKATRRKARKAPKRAPTKTPREKNDRTLQSIFVSLLANAGAPMSTDELAEGAKAEGYRTVSQNFRQVGYMLLTKRPNVFRKNAAGNWTLKGKAANG